MFSFLKKYQKVTAAIFLALVGASMLSFFPAGVVAQADENTEFLEANAEANLLQAQKNLIRKYFDILDRKDLNQAEAATFRGLTSNQLRGLLEVVRGEQGDSNTYGKTTEDFNGLLNGIRNELAEQTAFEKNQRKENEPISCESGGFSGFISAIFSNDVGNTVLCAGLASGEFVIWGFSLVLELVISLVNFAVKVSVTDFKDLISDGVYSAWRASRDVANLFFIFLFLYAALGYMLNLPSMGNVKSYVVRLITVAIFINFSFLATSFVIDITNVAAQTLYVQMTKNVEGGLGGLLVSKLSAYNDLSNSAPLGAAVNGLSVEDIKEIRAKQLKNASEFGIWDALVSVLGGSLVILSAALAFFIGAALLMLRTISLIFSLAIAPLAFLTSLFPKFDYINMWRDNLIKNALFAPAYMLMMYISLQAITGIQGIARSSGSDFALGLIMEYILFIGLLFGGVYIANQLGVAGAGWASGLVKGAGDKLRAGATAGVLGAGAYALQRPRNAIANRLEQAQKENSRLGQFARLPLIRDIPSAQRTGIEEEQKSVANYSSDALKQMHAAVTTSDTRKKAIIKELAKRGDLSPDSTGVFTSDTAREGIQSLKDAGVIRDEKAGQLDSLQYQYADVGDPAQWGSAIRNIDASNLPKIESDRFRAITASSDVRGGFYKNINGHKVGKLLENKETSDLFFSNLVEDYKQSNGMDSGSSVDFEDISEWVKTTHGNTEFASYLKNNPTGSSRLRAEQGVGSSKERKEKDEKEQKDARDRERHVRETERHEAEVELARERTQEVRERRERNQQTPPSSPLVWPDGRPINR